MAFDVGGEVLDEVEKGSHYLMLLELELALLVFYIRENGVECYVNILAL